MTGAPRSAYADDDFVIVRGEAVRELGDYNTAGVFQRIAWRCERTGGWRVTVAEIAAECWLTEKQVRRCLDRLVREVGWVTTYQEHKLDRTLTYAVVWSDRTCPQVPYRAFGAPQGALAVAPQGTSSSIETGDLKARDMGSADADIAICSLREILADHYADDLDAEVVWNEMRAEGIRHPHRFAADLADRGELDGYLAVHGFGAAS